MPRILQRVASHTVTGIQRCAPLQGGLIALIGLERITGHGAAIIGGLCANHFERQKGQHTNQHQGRHALPHVHPAVHGDPLGFRLGPIEPRPPGHREEKQEVKNSADLSQYRPLRGRGLHAQYTENNEGDHEQQ